MSKKKEVQQTHLKSKSSLSQPTTERSSDTGEKSVQFKGFPIGLRTTQTQDDETRTNMKVITSDTIFPFASVNKSSTITTTTMLSTVTTRVEALPLIKHQRAANAALKEKSKSRNVGHSKRS